MSDNVGGFLQVDRDTRRFLRVLFGKVRLKAKRRMGFESWGLNFYFIHTGVVKSEARN